MPGKHQYCSLFLNKVAGFGPLPVNSANIYAQKSLNLNYASVHVKNAMFVILLAIGTSNHLFGRAIWNKLPECIFDNIEITRVKREQFQNFQKSREWFISKIVRTKHMITGKSHQINKHFVLKLIFFNSGQLHTS